MNLASWVMLAAGAAALGAGAALLPLSEFGTLVAAAACAATIAAIRGATSSLALADAVTLARAVLACLLAGAVGAGLEPALAARLTALAALALVLDAVDGWVARRRGATEFGARFDMETDAALGFVLCLLLAPKVGAWVVAIGLARYAFLAAGWAWPVVAAPLPPSARRRAVCAGQMIALVVALAPIVPPSVAAAIGALALAATAASFAADVAWLLRRA